MLTVCAVTRLVIERSENDHVPGAITESGVTANRIGSNCLDPVRERKKVGTNGIYRTGVDIITEAEHCDVVEHGCFLSWITARYSKTGSVRAAHRTEGRPHSSPL